MKTIVLLCFLLSAFVGCYSSGSTRPGSAESDSTKVMVRYSTDPSKIAKIDRSNFIKKFDLFYKDKNGRFFVKSYGNQRIEGFVMKYEDVFIEIPELDSASYLYRGLYLKDNSKVICEYPSSDGGNYVLLKDADPRTFQAFKSAYGGKDKNSVFYQTHKLSGLDPSTVKVYSTMRICSNCTAYFTDGEICYLGDQKIQNNCKIPSEFDVVE
jgi:hypothetical protein